MDVCELISTKSSSDERLNVLPQAEIVKHKRQFVMLVLELNVIMLKFCSSAADKGHPLHRVQRGARILPYASDGLYFSL